METGILLRLLLAHIVTDFVFQPGSWVKDKQEKKIRSKFLYYHVLITGIVAYIATWHWGGWKIALIIMLSHFLVDTWKLYGKNNLVYFLIDQLLHIMVIITSWILIYKQFTAGLFNYIEWNRIWTYALVFGFIIWPVGYIVSFATAQWRKRLEEEAGESLEQAGKYIGMLERILVMIFILTGRYETIGLLIAAKSILRFSESKARKHTEYVLIGTMLSFAITLIIGLAAQYYLDL